MHRLPARCLWHVVDDRLVAGDGQERDLPGDLYSGHGHGHDLFADEPDGIFDSRAAGAARWLKPAFVGAQHRREDQAERGIHQ